MNDIGIKDTTAYRITRQIMDHIYGNDEKLSNNEFIFIVKSYMNHGGSWESLISGDVKYIRKLENIIDLFINYRRSYRKGKV